MFFVSTAPLSGEGHVNVSPKGGKYFGVLDRKTFWYQELTGSGNETISHIYEPGNNRVTIMLNAYEGPPRIMRLFGHGRVFENGTPAFNDFVKEHQVECIPGTRSIILVDIHQVGTSCGFSVPYYDFKDYRPILNDFFKKKAQREAAGHSSDSMPRCVTFWFTHISQLQAKNSPRYWALKNAWSMDGLPGTKTAQSTMKAEKIEPLKKMTGPFAPTHFGYRSGGFGVEHLLLASIVSALFTVLLLLYGAQIAGALQDRLPIAAKSALITFREKIR